MFNFTSFFTTTSTVFDNDSCARTGGYDVDFFDDAGSGSSTTAGCGEDGYWFSGDGAATGGVGGDVGGSFVGDDGGAVGDDGFASGRVVVVFIFASVRVFCLVSERAIK